MLVDDPFRLARGPGRLELVLDTHLDAVGVALLAVLVLARAVEVFETDAEAVQIITIHHSKGL